MKIYVGYEDWGWDGFSQPRKVTVSKEEIIAWTKRNMPANYVALELEDQDE